MLPIRRGIPATTSPKRTTSYGCINMGEYAEDALQQALDFDFEDVADLANVLDFQEDDVLRALFNRSCRFPKVRYPRVPGYEKTCQYCGLRNLRWTETSRGWRLIDTAGEVHLCQTVPRPEPEDEFSDVPDDDEYTRLLRDEHPGN